MLKHLKQWPLDRLKNEDCSKTSSKEELTKHYNFRSKALYVSEGILYREKGKHMKVFSSLRQDQKEAVLLLQIGTFLEYFDLMLYVHMAVLLNDLFFPKTDPHTAALLSAFAFCSTFIMRPFGALLFGYIGDNIGRKTTVILTTMLMATSCIVMANLPTYAQMGITVSWAVMLCRILQGLSSMGEVIGANLYLTEITKPPERYPVVATLAVCTALGALTALIVASFVTTSGFNWRIAFWIGAGIALIGSAARTRLRETPDFVDMKLKIKRAVEDAKSLGLGTAALLLQTTNKICKEKVNKKTFIYYFLVLSGWPVCFYFSYVHCGGILKNQFGYTPEQIIHQNLEVSLFQLLTFFLAAQACKWIDPLKIVKARSYVFYGLILALPFLMNNLSSGRDVFIIQSLFIFLGLIDVPAVPVFIIHFPVYRRFTCESFAYALSRALMYVVTSFSFIYVTEFLGNWGLWVIMVPISIGFHLGVCYFEKLERNRENSIIKPLPQTIPMADVA